MCFHPSGTGTTKLELRVLEIILLGNDAGPVTFILLCLEGEKCAVYFEPWGAEHVLHQDDFFRVRATGFHPEEIEVAYVRGGLLVTLAGGGAVEVTDKAGREVRL